MYKPFILISLASSPHVRFSRGCPFYGKVGLRRILPSSYSKPKSARNIVNDKNIYFCHRVPLKVNKLYTFISKI